MLARDSFEHIHERSNPYNRYRQAWKEEPLLIFGLSILTNASDIGESATAAAKGKRDESKI